MGDRRFGSRSRLTTLLVLDSGAVIALSRGQVRARAFVTKAVADFMARYVLQDRCPADDQLEGRSLCQTYGSGSQVS